MNEKTSIINDSTGTAFIKQLPKGGYEITVKPCKKVFCSRFSIKTRYSFQLIKNVAKVYGVAWMLDEIARDEDPNYIEMDLRLSLLSYHCLDEFFGKSLLDFGCGGGASTLVISRIIPKLKILGIELVPTFVEIAKARAKFYGNDYIDFRESIAGGQIPSDLPQFDFILLSAVFEHLLPQERTQVISQLWKKLRLGGILFVNQTPDLRFPIETHTTGLPLINYMPNVLAHKYACNFSSRVKKIESWENLLRKGIRGTTPKRLFNLIKSIDDSKSVQILKPCNYGIKKQSQIWYHAVGQRTREHWSLRSFKVFKILQSLSIRFGIPLAPYLSLAFKKG